MRNRADNHNKGRLSNQDTDEWRKRPPVLGSEVAVPENYTSAENPEIKSTSDSSTQMVDLADGQAQVKAYFMYFILVLLFYVCTFIIQF